MFNKKVLSLFALSLMIIGLFSSLVSADPIIDPIVDFAKSIGSDWNQGSGFSFGVAKLFIFIILWALLVGLVGKLPGLSGEESSKKMMRFFLSFAIAFLASAYFTATEVAVIVSSYSALGFVLGGIVPFMIMVFWTSSVISSMGRSRYAKSAKTWTLRGMWSLFGAYFLYKVLSAGGSTGIDANSWVVWGQWLLVALSFAVVLLTPFIIKMVVKEENERVEQLVVGDAAMRGELRAKKAVALQNLKDKIDNAKGFKKGYP